MEKISFNFKIKKSNYHCEYQFDEKINFIYIQIDRNHSNVIFFQCNGNTINYSGAVARKLYSESKTTEEFIEKMFSFFFRYLDKYSGSLSAQNKAALIENKKIIQQIEEKEQ